MNRIELKRRNAYMRIVVLVSNVVTSLSGSIFVIYTRELARALGKGDPNALTALCQTVSSIGMLLGVFFAPTLFRAMKSIRRYLYVSCIGFSIVCFIQYAFQNYYLFATVGAIYSAFIGLFSMVGTYYALGLEDEKDRYDAQASLTAGNQAGQGVATIVGSIIATQLDYRYVYLVMSVLTILFMLLVKQIKCEEVNTKDEKSNSFRVLTNPRAIFYLLCLTIPNGAIQVFLTYKLPLDIVDLGYSTMMVSFILLIKRFVGVYTAPIMNALTGKHLSKMQASIVYLILISGVLTLYAFTGNIFMIFIIVFLLGLLDSFGYNALSTAFYGTRKDDSYTDKDSSSVYHIVVSLGRMVGPNMISFTGTVLSLPIFTVAGVGIYTLASALFFRKKERA